MCFSKDGQCIHHYRITENIFLVFRQEGLGVNSSEKNIVFQCTKKGGGGGNKKSKSEMFICKDFTIIWRKTVNKEGWNFLRGGGNDSAQNSNQ